MASLINNPDGTITIQGATVSYLVDVNQKFRVMTACNNSNATYAGTKQNGTTVCKGSIIEVQVNTKPLPSSITPVPARGIFQIWRSADLVFTWDSSKLEFIDAVADSFLTDKSVIDTTKISAIKKTEGVGIFHSEVLPVPEKRTPKQTEQPFQWNLDGYVWTNSSRNIGKIRFKVISDFYYPSEIPTDIKIHNEFTVNGEVLKSKIDGGAAPGTNIIGDIQNNANQIKSGPSPEYKVNLALSGPTTPVSIGSTIDVKVLATPATLPQVIYSVVTMFAWDNTKLELMSIDKTGAKASITSEFFKPCPTCINEAVIPKHGVASHYFLSALGDKKPIDKETLITTLKFKVLADFTDTKIEIINKQDPRVSGMQILDDMGILGSCIPGSITGTLTNSIIKGSL